MKRWAQTQVSQLKAAGLTDADIAKMATTGKPPDVHHIQALSLSGTKASSNLVLVHTNPEHYGSTHQQATGRAGIKVGEKAIVECPGPARGDTSLPCAAIDWSAEMTSNAATLDWLDKVRRYREIYSAYREEVGRPALPPGATDDESWL